MAQHKKQHYVPALKAWCDPNAPREQTPYVWVFDKEGNAARRKAPENIFYETDMYTIEDSGGQRLLHLEHCLQQLETAFARIRETKLKNRQKLTSRETILLCAFIGAQQFRTPASAITTVNNDGTFAK